MEERKLLLKYTKWKEKNNGNVQENSRGKFIFRQIREKFTQIWKNVTSACISNKINAVISEEVESSCDDCLNINMIFKIVFINTIYSFKC